MRFRSAFMSGLVLALCMALFGCNRDTTKPTETRAKSPEAVDEASVAREESAVAADKKLGGVVTDDDKSIKRVAKVDLSNKLPVDWDMQRLTIPPATFPAPGFSAEGVRALFYENASYRGQPTRVFAWLGLPELKPGETCPAMVLLHGGGGTAFDEWVRLWNRRGYAALAMDLTGCVPERPHPIEGKTHERHAHGGPPGWNHSFDQADEPVGEQWIYHVVAAAMGAHSLLAGQPEVDPRYIGLTGLSWGGYLTCIVAGADSRFCAAAPVYGCGFIDYDSSWKDNGFPRYPPGRIRRWLELWEPAPYLSQARMPMCWVTGTNDPAFPLNAFQKSYLLPSSPRALCIRVEMPHSHVDGWNPPELEVFMDHLVRGTPPLPRFLNHGRKGDHVWATCSSAQAVARAELCSTRALGHWMDRKWTASPVKWDAATGRIEAALPPRSTAWFFNVFDDRNCVASTPHEEVSP